MHYALVGTYQRIDPHPLFDTDWYCRIHKLRDCNTPILTHYLTLGVKERFSPHEYFDVEYYVTNHPESASHPGGPVAHFLQIGHLMENNPSPRFDVRRYLKANADVRVASVNPLIHFVRHGRAEGRSPKAEDLPLRRFGAAEYGGAGEALQYAGEVTLSQDFSLTIAVHLHLFYIDLVEEFCARLAHIPASFTLFISINSSEVDVQELESLFAKRLPQCANVVVRRFPNRGRDIAPFLVEFGNDLSKFDLILHLHSKKYTDVRADWRRLLVHYTLGSRAVVSQILDMFKNDNTVGIVRPPYHGALRCQPNWGANKSNIERLLQRMALTLTGEDCPDYPAGSFFWARTDAIRPLFESGFTLDDFPETGKIDGTFDRAIERILGVLPIARGYKQVCRYIDVAHNLVNYYVERRYGGFAIDRSLDISYLPNGGQSA